MKKMMLVLTGGLVLAFFANCGKNDDSPKTGTAEMSGACYNLSRSGQTGYAGGNCAYPYSSTTPGFTSATTYQYTVGFIGNTGVSSCGASQAQAYSPSKGMACVVTTQITMSGQPVIYDMNTMTGNFYPISQPNPNFAYQNQAQTQYGYAQTYPYGMNNLATSYLPVGQTQTYRVCDSAEPCPSAQSCRPALLSQSTSGIGLCYF